MNHTDIMASGVQVFCFAASYFVALALEITGIWVRTVWRRPLVIGVTLAGLVAHTWYLGRRAIAEPHAPLASSFDWFLAAAWLVVVVTLVIWFYFPRSPAGLFFLPVVLALIGASQFAPTSPPASFQAPRFWGRAHAVCLMLGTVVMICGFLAGVMYLWQSYRLKRKLPPGERFRLPSLEWLERVNSRALGISTLLVGVGFITGVLGRLAHGGEQGVVPWTDPVVLSLAAMLGWLLAAEIFRLVYPAARQGRKVAYLTLAAFIFLLITLASVALLDQAVHPGMHGANALKHEIRNIAEKQWSGNATTPFVPQGRATPTQDCPRDCLLRGECHVSQPLKNPRNPTGKGSDIFKPSLAAMDHIAVEAPSNHRETRMPAERTVRSA